jgi:hypothetical protein
VTWSRHSDDYSDRADIMGLSDAAYRAHDAALIWSNRQLTNGFIPEMAMPVVLAYVRGDHRDAVLELEAADLWEHVDDGWLIDWTDQEEADAVKGRRDRTAQRQAAWRERSSRHRVGDHSMCDPTRCKGAKVEAELTPLPTRNGSRNASRNALRNGAPTHPVPTPPLPSSLEEGEGAVRLDADASAAAREAARRYSDPSNWNGDTYQPLDYLEDTTARHEGGWNPERTSWSKPMVWREGWNPRARRPGVAS